MTKGETAVSIAAQIVEGYLDDELEGIEQAIKERRGGQLGVFRERLKVGTRAKLTNTISPKYLRGLPVVVVQEMTTGRSYDLKVKPEPGEERFFGRYNGEFRVKRSMLDPIAD